jgi:hypothetical protein
MCLRTANGIVSEGDGEERRRGCFERLCGLVGELVSAVGRVEVGL